MARTKGAVGAIFTVIIMVVIFFSAYAFLSQFLDATPEQQALRDFKEGIDFVCDTGGPDAYTVSIVLPSDSPTRLKLKPDGTVTLQVVFPSSVPTAPDIKAKVLNCPLGTTFAECTIGPTAQGFEYVPVEILKSDSHITLNETEQIKCKETVV